MDNLNSIATSMIAFTGLLIGAATIVFYMYQIKETMNVLYVIMGVNIYILINLLFLYMIKRGITEK